MEKFDDEMMEGSVYYNFNDYLHSFGLLLSIMLIGWLDYIFVGTIKIGDSWWNNLYYLSFFMLTNTILWNIIIGTICDSTSAILKN